MSNWGAHTSATEDKGRCERYKDCPFMGKMPGLVKISLGGANNVGDDNHDGTDKDENNKFYDDDSENSTGIDGVADLESQSDKVYDNENDGEHEPVMVHDEDEPESDAKDEVENTSCKKFCCFF